MFLIDGSDEAAGYSTVRGAIVGWWEAIRDGAAAAANLVGWEASVYLPRGFQDDLVGKSNVV
jgi:hypothetical protein